MVNFEWIRIPSGNPEIGSTLEEIDRAYHYWKDRLLNKSYESSFRSYLMKEYPKYQIRIPSFEVSDTLVTNKLYQNYINETNARAPESLVNKDLGMGDDYPVWGVKFEEAKDFCDWFGRKIHCSVTLPSEAEWEYAARGETRREFPWGSDWNMIYCNTFESGINRTTPVRQFMKGRSIFGIYDMAGNVEEWVDTTYKEHPGGEIIEDDIYVAVGENYKILKGGSFARGGDLCRVARRHGPHPDPMFRFTGFRIIRR